MTFMSPPASPSVPPPEEVKKRRRPKPLVARIVSTVKKSFPLFVVLGAWLFYRMSVVGRSVAGGILAFLLMVIYLPPDVPYRWELKLMVAQGLSFPQWLSYLWDNNFSVDMVYWHRAVFITVLSILNSISWLPQEEKHYPEKEVRAVKIEQPPIFILGHFRSGTSLLHELMNKDPRFVAPSVFQCFAPKTFLSQEGYVMSNFAGFNFRRPMDSMKLRLDSPQEDEFALCNITGLSPYMGALFSKRVDYYGRYLTFREVPKEEVEKWKDSIVVFYKKVLFKHRDKRLILKSPTHTARLKILHDIFPDAKFVHISRNPYEIYLSTQKLYLDLLIQWNLQLTDYEANMHKIVVNLFEDMYKAHFEDRKVLNLGSNQLADVRYEELIKSPVAVLEKIYADLQLGGWEDIKPEIQKYEEEQQKKFKTNKHPQIREEEAKEIRERWSLYFKAFGYSLDD